LAEDEDNPVVEITAIIDPLSRAAQKLAPILQTLLKVLNADFRLAMNPKQQLSESIEEVSKIKTSENIFSNICYLLQSDSIVLCFMRNRIPKFGKNGQLVTNVAQFHELPQKQLLTMHLIVPDAWMVQPVWAEYDLDNIRVAMVSRKRKMEGVNI
jgi:UDP-glucose:glycoprotein glucosyltransferase